MKYIFAVIAVMLMVLSFSFKNITGQSPVFAETIHKELTKADDWYIDGLASLTMGIVAKARKMPDEAIENFTKAIEEFTKAIALDPNHAEAYSGRGMAYKEEGQVDRAISDFQKACDMGNTMACKDLQELKNR